MDAESAAGQPIVGKAAHNNRATVRVNQNSTGTGDQIRPGTNNTGVEFRRRSNTFFRFQSCRHDAEHPFTAASSFGDNFQFMQSCRKIKGSERHHGSRTIDGRFQIDLMPHTGKCQNSRAIIGIPEQLHIQIPGPRRRMIQRKPEFRIFIFANTIEQRRIGHPYKPPVLNGR